MPKFKPLTIGTLPRVFVNVLALNEGSISLFAAKMSDSTEMETWFELTKTIPLPYSARHPTLQTYTELQVRRDLSRFFLAILNLSKVTRGMFVKDFSRLLNDLGRQDFWGTEGQCDPRGDRRDTGRYDYGE